MVVHRGGQFSVELVEAHRRFQCPEETDPDSGEVFANIDPETPYLLRIQVLDGGGDANRKFLFYININDLYIGYRTCLSQNDGFKDVGLYSFSEYGELMSTNEPVRFQEGSLLEKGATTIQDSFSMSDSNDKDKKAWHTEILHMGKVTVKIYEGLIDPRSRSAFGNNLDGDEAYQPGRFVETITLHCATGTDLGITYLAPEDRERLRKAESKRSFVDNNNDEENTTPTNCQRRTFKRMKTESGYVGVIMQQSSSFSFNSNNGSGVGVGGAGTNAPGLMEFGTSEMVMHPAPRFA